MHAVEPVWVGDVSVNWEAELSKCLLLGTGVAECCERVFTGVQFVRFGADLGNVKVVVGESVVFVYYPLGYQWLFAGYVFRVVVGWYEGYFIGVYDYNLDRVEIHGNEIRLCNREISVSEGYLLDSSCRGRLFVDIDFIRYVDNIVSLKGDLTPYTVVHKDNGDLVVQDGIYVFTLCGNAECFELELTGY